MKLLALAIDRFGSRRNLRLDGLKPQLNVVVGPNGSGKSTIMQFVRWMLYGEAEAESRAFVVLARERVGGSLELLDDQQRRRRITRHRGPDGRTGLGTDAR